MATITKTPSNTCKAIVRKRGWPTINKTFRTKCDAQDWARRTETKNGSARTVPLTRQAVAVFRAALDNPATP